MIHLRPFDLWCSQFSQQTKVNKQTIESLAPRVEGLIETLCAPTSKGDSGEEVRRRKLER